MTGSKPQSKDRDVTREDRETLTSGFFSTLAGYALKHRWMTVIVYGFLALCGLILSFTKLEIDTDPGRMISSELPFRQHFAELNKTFPQSDNIFVVVIDGENSEAGRNAAQSIAAAFKAKPGLFSHVHAPGTEAFFDSHGVLYLDKDQITNIVTQIEQTRPLFLTLSKHPDLSGIEQLFDLILLGADTGNLPADATLFLSEAAKTLDSQIAGKSHNFDWEGLGPKDQNVAPAKWYVLAKPVLDFSALEPAEAPLQEARRILADPNANPLGPKMARLTGEAAVNAEELTSVTQGAALAGIISFCLVTLLVFFGMPFKRLIVPIVAMLIAGILINAGFAALTIGHLNMISVAFAVLFIGLGIDYAVHFVLRYAEAITDGAPFEDAIAQSAANIGPALWLCTLTTSIAFLVFSFTDFVGMAQLGIIAAGGIIIAFVASLTLIPALLSFMQLPANLANKGSVQSGDNTAGSVGVSLRPIVSIAVILLAIASGFLIPNVRFDGDPINLKDPEAPSVTVFNELIRTEPGLVYAAQIITRENQQPGQLIAALENLKSVKTVNSIETFVPKDQAAKIDVLHKLKSALPSSPRNDGDIGNPARKKSLEGTISLLEQLAVADRAPPEIRKQAGTLAKKFIVAQTSVASTDDGLKDLERAFIANVPQMFTRLNAMADMTSIDVNSLPEDIRARYVASGGRQRIEVIPSGNMRNEAELESFVRAVSALAPNVTGAPVEIAGAAATVTSAMKTAGLAALALIAVLLIFIFRRVRDVALVFVPIVLSVLLLLGYTVVFDAPFNFANIIVFPLLLGLGVDSSIHYVMRLREGAYQKTIEATSTPRAVLISALTTIGSFGTLWMSPHLGLSSMGELLTVSIACTLVCTLVVLPQIVKWTSTAA